VNRPQSVVIGNSSNMPNTFDLTPITDNTDIGGEPANQEIADDGDDTRAAPASAASIDDTGAAVDLSSSAGANPQVSRSLALRPSLCAVWRQVARHAPFAVLVCGLVAATLGALLRVDAALQRTVPTTAPTATATAATAATAASTGSTPVQARLPQSTAAAAGCGAMRRRSNQWREAGWAWACPCPTLPDAVARPLGVMKPALIRSSPGFL